MRRIICHWTAGGHKATSLDKKHYHFIFEGDGKLVKGNHPISANDCKVSKGYAAHTRGCNSYSIGLSMACMRGAKERPLNYGTAPMTKMQWDAMCMKAAELCLEYDIPVTDKTVLSHAEVEKNLGIKQRGKWDFTVLPFDTSLKGAKACGDRLRKDVQAYIDMTLRPVPEPRPVPIPKPVPLPPEKVEEVLREDGSVTINEADKVEKSIWKQLWSLFIGSGGAGASYLQGMDWRIVAVIAVAGLIGFGIYSYASYKAAQRIKRNRVEDAITGKHIGRENALRKLVT